MAFETTPAHQAIFDAIKNKDGHVQIEAVAGSGKTTTIVEALKLIDPDERCLFLAFNKSIATELGRRVPKNTEARTLNSLGHRAYTDLAMREGWISSRRELRVNADKMRDLLFRLEDDGRLDREARVAYGLNAVKLARLAKSNGLIPDGGPREGLMADEDQNWWRMIDLFNVDLPDIEDAFARVVGLTKTLLDLSLRERKTIDFDDQLYMTFAYDARCTRYDRVFVDEAQDLSPLQHELLTKALKTSGQLVAVGDPCQAIYGFRGADASSMETLHRRFGTTKLPLHVSYRCPKKVVEVAAMLVPHLKAHASAPDGVVENIPVSPDKADLRGGDLVVCRTTAPAVSLAYRLLREGKRAEVLGRDIGKGLAALIKKLGNRGDVGDFLAKLSAWEDKEITKANKNKRGTSEAKIAQIQEKAACLRILAEGTDTVGDLLALVEDLFSGTRDATKVTLCTVHKAKGLEADRVWVLNRHLMPHPMAKQPWEQVQERNLQYVAFTRAKKELRFVTISSR